jgi:proteasome lid subunit RPN8/RPN11
MKYNIANRNLSLKISQDILDEMYSKALASFPNETGGMFAGYISEDGHEAIVELLVVPSKTESTYASFVRETDGMEQMWRELSEQGLTYLGEWHTHPKGTTQYSNTDYQAMVGIANDRNVALATPLLFIISLNESGITDSKAYLYDSGILLKFESMIDLKEMFAGLQTEMNAALNINRFAIHHQGSKGDATEDKWIEFLRTYLPKRYNVDKAMVIDHEGNVSQQIDIVLYDVFYTPFIFNHDGFKYIPAEGVYAVFEVKQDIKNNIEYAGKKIESVRKLKRTSIPMICTGCQHNARPLSPILGGILTTTSSYEQCKTIEENLKKLSGMQSLDLCCCADKYSFYIEYDKSFAKFKGIETKDIYDHYDSRKIIAINFNRHPENSIFTFFLQLVQYLKLIGTVPAIDINAYLGTVGENIDMDL